MTDDGNGKTRTWTDRLSLWVGLAGSVITIVLTIWNTRTKTELDRLQASLQERTTGVEESKERVDRYKWVLSLLPSLTDADNTKRTFTISLVKLALTQEEAEQLFAGLQSSPTPELKQVGQQGFDSIASQELSRLILRINGSAADDRKAAVAELIRQYVSSAMAVSLVLDLYAPDRLKFLSPSGIINGLYFLAATDASAWDKPTIERARDTIQRVAATSPGPQTSSALDTLQAKLNSFH